jgi:hypothetical protein
LELEILDAWGQWYVDALKSCGDYFLKKSGSEAYQALEDDYITRINQLMTDAKDLADETFILTEKEAS